MRGRVFRLLAGLCLALAAAPAFCQEPHWLLLERGKRLFREGRYGEAILFFEDALRNRKELYEKARSALVDALSLPEVRSFGDDLSRAKEYVDSRRLRAASDALALLYADRSVEALGNSADKALSELRRLGDYPEAEFWLGEVFRVEGETSLALAQYEKALKHRETLEIPDEARDIRYRMAALHAVRREYPAMESRLLEIAAEDPLWSSRKDSFVREAMLRTLAADGVDRFLTLYRHAASATYQAQLDLGVHYYRTGRHDRAAAHLVFAFLIASTAVIDELRSADLDYSFGGLAAALDAARASPAAAAYLQTAEYYRMVYYLAAALYADGRRKTAAELWRLAAGRPEAGEWGGRSSRQLASPFIEPPTDKP